MLYLIQKSKGVVLMSIGSRIKEARKQKNLTQEELSSIVGVTKGAIANYENQVSTPKIEILFKLIKALGVDANYIYQDDMEIKGSSSLAKEDKSSFQLSPQDALHLGKYKKLNTIGRQKADEQLDDLLLITKYTVETEDQSFTCDESGQPNLEQEKKADDNGDKPV